MNNRWLTKFASVLALVCLLLASYTTPAQAAGVKTDDVMVISDDIDDDLYAAAQTFTLSATIHGDLIVFARTITITPNGVVEGDIMGAGQDIIIQGEVKGDMRMAGAVLMVTSTGIVDEDLIAAGYSLELEPGSPIGGDVMFAGSQATFSGSITGDTDVACEGLILNGRVGGKMRVYVGREDAERFSLESFPGLGEVQTIPGGLSFGPQATIGTALDYHSPQEFIIPEHVVTSDKVTYHQDDFRWDQIQPVREVSVASKAANWFVNQFRWYASLLLVGLLLAWATPELTRKSAEQLKAKPWHSLGWGFVSLFGLVFAVLSLIVIVTMLGILLGILKLGELLVLEVVLGLLVIIGLVLVYVIAAVLVAKVIISYLGGQLILARIKPEWANSRIWPLVFGLVIVIILTALPFYIGQFINLVIILLGLGALWMAASEWIWRKPSKQENQP